LFHKIVPLSGTIPRGKIAKTKTAKAEKTKKARFLAFLSYREKPNKKAILKYGLFLFGKNKSPSAD